MIDYETFMNIDIDTKDFQEVYNSMADNKLVFAGGKMKSTGTQYWQSPNTDATNESGFSGLPGGLRSHIDGTFIQYGYIAFFWSAESGSATSTWDRRLFNDDGDVDRGFTDKRSGCSVRCLRD